MAPGRVDLPKTCRSAWPGIGIEAGARLGSWVKTYTSNSTDRPLSNNLHGNGSTDGTIYRRTWFCV